MWLVTYHVFILSSSNISNRDSLVKDIGQSDMLFSYMELSYEYITLVAKNWMAKPLNMFDKHYQLEILWHWNSESRKSKIEYHGTPLI